jgi:hypothetical protein
MKKTVLEDFEKQRNSDCAWIQEMDASGPAFTLFFLLTWFGPAYMYLD